MNPVLVQGDPASCSRLGAALRREGARLAERQGALRDTQRELAAWTGAAGDAARARLASQLVALAACADSLDRAGAVVQRYATDLAEAEELGRRAQREALAAGLQIVDGRVVEPWGVATSVEAERRRAALPRVQAQVELATAAAERAQSLVRRAALELTDDLALQSGRLRGMHRG